MKTLTLTAIVLAILLVPSLALAAGEVYLSATNTYSDTIWYEGGTNIQDLPWRCAPLTLTLTVQNDTNVMAFAIDLAFPGGKLHCASDAIQPGSFLTGSSSDSYFFNVSVTQTIAPGAAGSDTITITGSRMDATAGEKALTGDTMELATALKFYRVATNDLYGDSVCVLGGSLKFRDMFNSAPTSTAIRQSGWFFQAKPFMSDVNLSGGVNVGDVLATRARTGASIEDNTTYDVNESGGINVGDVLKVRAESGSSY